MHQAEMCLVERILLQSDTSAMYRQHAPTSTRGRPSYALAALSESLLDEDQWTSISSGALRSVHLYAKSQSRSSLQFLVAVFQGSDGTQSCVRVEWGLNSVKRATSPSGGIACVAPMLGSVTFACDMDELLEEGCYEIASASVTLFLEHFAPLEDVGRQVLAGLQTSPSSQDRRWLPQNSFLDIVHRLNHNKIEHSLYWKGSPTSSESLKQNLQHHPPLTTPRSSIARGWYAFKKPSLKQAVQKTKEILSVINKLSRRSAEHQNLLSVTLRLQGLAQRDLGQTSEALDSLRQALKAALRSPSTDRYVVIDAQDSLASVLIQNRQIGEAIELRRAAITALREIYEDTHFLSPLNTTFDEWTNERTSGHRLARVLHNYGTDLSYLTGREAERVEVYREEVELYEELEREHSDRFAHGLGVAMMECATALHGLGQTQEAIDLSLKALPLARTLFESNQEQFGGFLGRTLYNHAIYASKLRLWGEACRAGTDCAEHYRKLYHLHGAIYADDLVDVLMNYGYDLHSAGRTDEAVPVLKEALDVLLDQPDPERHRKTIGDLYFAIASLRASGS